MMLDPQSLEYLGRPQPASCHSHMTTPGRSPSETSSVLAAHRPLGRKITPCNHYRRVICRVCHFRGPSRSVPEPGFMIIAALRNVL